MAVGLWRKQRESLRRLIALNLDSAWHRRRMHSNHFALRTSMSVDKVRALYGQEEES